MLIIGENINATNKTIAEAIINRNKELLQNLAVAQAEAGADLIDINAGLERLETIGPLAAEYKASVIALAMGSEGIPDNSGEKLTACERIINHRTKAGITPEQIYFDPLVLPVSVDSNQSMVTLETIRQIKSRYPTAKTAMGLSNISFGLPNRKLINRGFLLMAAYAGLDAAILDSLDNKTISLIKVADMLLGNDQFCRNYNRAHRKGQIVE